MPPPPVKSRYDNDMPTAYEVKRQCEVARNEKARLRMAEYVRPVPCITLSLTLYVFSVPRKYAELKTRPLEEQQLARERSNVYQAKYHAKLYAKRYGSDAPAVYLKARCQHKLAGTAQRSRASWDMRDVPYGFGYHPEENDGIVGMTPIPAKYMHAM
ncbi:hypothetical protein DFH08DRAFT_966106 [Mycena albidolilacea]|uniref:Uncharacterized protein n=1 Tax=Mycena albidolilacea TaxID=1033008 RepID=A0AAD6ZP52_9AGAR|nr:hypothetical protein DFH08DRAFT_966106 [Mycena albidolilacea]